MAPEGDVASEDAARSAREPPGKDPPGAVGCVTVEPPRMKLRSYWHAPARQVGGSTHVSAVDADRGLTAGGAESGGLGRGSDQGDRLRRWSTGIKTNDVRGG